MERIIIEIMITRKNRREPILILQSANETLYLVFHSVFSKYRIESRDQKISRDQKCEISRENIYLVKTLLYNKTM